MERRFLTVAAGPISLESRGEGKPPILVGYGAVFHDPAVPGTEYKLGRGLKERIMPTAFDRALKEGQDVRGLFNHDANCLLGRCSAGTMKLSKDIKGLRYEITPPDTQTGRDVVELVKRGDLTGSSFSFRPVMQKFVVGATGEDDIRELHDVDLFDTGPVSFPAYDAATAGLRSLGDLPAEVREAWQTATILRAAIMFEASPTFDGDAWDGSAAEGRVRSWASQGDTTDWGKYRRAFAWYNSKDPNMFGAYKLIHHDLRDGKLVVHRKGVIAAMEAMMGGRGGVDLPKEDREPVYRHLARHYEQFKMEPPELKEAWAPGRETLAMRQRLIEAEVG